MAFTLGFRRIKSRLSDKIGGWHNLLRTDTIGVESDLCKNMLYAVSLIFDSLCSRLATICRRNSSSNATSRIVSGAHCWLLRRVAPREFAKRVKIRADVISHARPQPHLLCKDRTG